MSNFFVPTFFLLTLLFVLFFGMATAPSWPNLSKILSPSKAAKMYNDCQNWNKSKNLKKMLAILQDQIPSLHVWAMLDQGKKVNYPTVLAELKTIMHKMKLQNTLNGVPDLHLSPSLCDILKVWQVAMLKTLDCASSVHQCTKEECDGVDPHNWTDLDNVFEQIVLEICIKPRTEMSAPNLYFF